jgi:hypothetical protein
MMSEPLDKIGKANRDAWDAAKKIAKSMRKDYKKADWSKLPWHEIRRQLRETGDVVDTTRVPPCWLSESPQMVKMRLILEEAGFRAEDHLYRWNSAA